MDFKETQIGRLLTDIKLAMIAHTPIVNIVTSQLEIVNQLLWDKDCADALIPRLKYDTSLGEFIHVSGNEADGYCAEVCNYHIGKFPRMENIDTPVLIVNFTTDWKNLKESTTSFVKAYLNINVSDKVHEFISRSVYIVVTPSQTAIPADLIPYVNTVRIRKMEDEEIANIIRDDFHENGIELSKVSASVFSQMVVNFRGFSRYRIKQVLDKSVGIHRTGYDLVDCYSVLREIRIEKKQLMDGCKGLEWVNVGNPSTAGLHSITKWLEVRKELFCDPEKAVKQHIDIPKGIIIAGIPGSGKSLMAKSAAHMLGLPLISLDMGALLGSLVGDSEHNMIEALQVAERMSPCILWIDEIEKAFSGSDLDSSHSDGGVGRRMFGKFLTWMQEKSCSCFVFATSNDVTSLPPELFRSERFDRKFFTFMPTAEECSEIFASNISKQNLEYKREISNLNYIQTLETPENLFDPELENPGFWFEFINDSFYSTVSAISLEDPSGAGALPKRYEWVEGKRPKFKLMTGADISSLVKLAKFDCYQNMKNSGNIASSSVYSTGVFMQCVRRLLHSDEFKPYGETNLKDIVKCFRKLYENQFSPASGKCIIDFEEYDSESGIYMHDADRQFDNSYDKALYYAVAGAVNHYVKTDE